MAQRKSPHPELARAARQSKDARHSSQHLSDKFTRADAGTAEVSHPSARLLHRFDLCRAVFELRDLAEGVELRVGEDVGGGLARHERDDGVWLFEAVA